jgi:sugar O-acyltransferase (sialic acid O-acetyltransferase NeuD family)
LKKPLIIFGAGGLGREVKTIIDASSDWYAAGYCDDNLPTGAIVQDITVLGGKSYLLDLNSSENVIVAIGNPTIRFNIVQSLKASALIRFPSLIHPRAVLGDNTITIGEGTIITAGCIITTSVIIGKYVLINLNSTIGHDCRIGDFTSIMPGVNIGGQVMLGEQVLVGSGSNILNKVSIGNKAIVGAGAMVLRDVHPGATVMGVPAIEKKKV